MKICIPSKKEGKDSLLDPRFGRCQFFAIVDTKNPDDIDFIKNTGVRANRGAGISAAQLVANKGIQAVVVVNLGPKALSVLTSANIDCFQTTQKTIKEVIDDFKKGNVKKMTSPAPGGFGMGQGRGQGPGKGLGRRQGR